MTVGREAAVELDEAAVLAAIGQVAHEQLGVAVPLESRMRLVEDLELDSVRALTLVVELENRFRICLEPEDEVGIATVGDLAGVVARKLADRADRDPQ